MNKIILTEENYFSTEAQMFYMGSSQFKQFQTCESQALAEIRGDYVRELSTALLVGSYVDAHFSKTLDVFRAQHPEIYKRNGDLLASYSQANDIIARIELDDQFMAAISGETQVIMTGTVEGVPVKVKIDSLLPDRTVDLKIMRDFKDIWSDAESIKVPWWKVWRYDIQAVFYQEVRKQNEDGIVKPFGIAGATKEKPESDIGLFEFPQAILDDTMDEIRSEIVYYDGLKHNLYEPESCGICAWCRSQKVLTGWVEI